MRYDDTFLVLPTFENDAGSLSLGDLAALLEEKGWGGGNNYVVDMDQDCILSKSITCSDGIYFWFYPGIVISGVGSPVLTLRSPEHVLSSPRQQIVGRASVGLAWVVPGTVYAEWWGAAASGFDVPPTRPSLPTTQPITQSTWATSPSEMTTRFGTSCRVTRMDPGMDQSAREYAGWRGLSN